MKQALCMTAVALAASLVVPAQAATWSTSAQYGGTTMGAYSFNNDIWGQGAGPQTLWVNSPADWGVWSNQPNTGGIKSYPHIGFYVGKPLSNLSRVTSVVSATTPAGSVASRLPASPIAATTPAVTTEPVSPKATSGTAN